MIDTIGMLLAVLGVVFVGMIVLFLIAACKTSGNVLTKNDKYDKIDNNDKERSESDDRS